MAVCEALVSDVDAAELSSRTNPSLQALGAMIDSSQGWMVIPRWSDPSSLKHHGQITRYDVRMGGGETREGTEGDIV